jgi:hypothetical protein
VPVFIATQQANFCKPNGFTVADLTDAVLILNLTSETNGSEQLTSGHIRIRVAPF